MKTMTLEEWRAEGTRRFGADPKSWRFKCPACGHEQGIQDFRDAGVEPNGRVYFSCIGRWTGGVDAFSEEAEQAGPCDYTCGGLIPLGPINVITDEEGTKVNVFGFADPVAEESVHEGS